MEEWLRTIYSNEKESSYYLKTQMVLRRGSYHWQGLKPEPGITEDDKEGGSQAKITGFFPSNKTLI